MCASCQTYRSDRNRSRRVQLRCGLSASEEQKNPFHKDGTEDDIGPDWPDSRRSGEH